MKAIKVIFSALMLQVCTLSNVFAVHFPNKFFTPCDTIILRNGDMIIGKIFKESKSTIFYNPCGDDPKVLKKPFTRISQIHYANGNHRDFENDPNVQTSKAAKILFVIVGGFLALFLLFILFLQLTLDSF